MLADDDGVVEVRRGDDLGRSGIVARVSVSPYDLRHTNASLLFHEGSSKAVQMVDAIREARRGVHDLCTPVPVKRLRQAAPGA